MTNISENAPKLTTFLNAEIIKTIEVTFNDRAMFRPPTVKRLRYNSIGKYILDKEWSDDLFLLNIVLTESFIPIYLWVILFFFSAGLLGFILIPYQKRKTTKAAKMLNDFVHKKNEEFNKKGIPIQYIIPVPSKEGVIIDVCIFDTVNSQS